MPAPKRKVRRRNAPTQDSHEDFVRWFASAGRHVPETEDVVFASMKSGEKLRDDWKAVRREVRRRVSRIAYEQLSAEFDRGPSRTFHHWPKESLSELEKLIQ